MFQLEDCDVGTEVTDKLMTKIRILAFLSFKLDCCRSRRQSYKGHQEQGYSQEVNNSIGSLVVWHGEGVIFRAWDVVLHMGHGMCLEPCVEWAEYGIS